MTAAMFAMRIHRYGGPDVLVGEECPSPVPAAGEALVRVHAAGVNPIDYRTRSGAGVARYWKDKPFPLTLGWDVSGAVAECGDGVTEFAAGDEVFALVRFPDPGACNAEYVSVPAAQLARKPRTLDHLHAAALPLAALTAWQALFVAAELVPGQRLLVHAAAGGVGHLAVQLGKWKGAEVIGTASARNEDFVRGLGVDRFVDYTKAAFDREVRDVDVQLDTVGKPVQGRAWGVMKKGGFLVSIVPEGGPLSQEAAAEHGVRAANLFVRPDGAALAEIAALVDTGRLRPFVERTYPLSELARAHEHVADGHTRGKVVVAVA